MFGRLKFRSRISLLVAVASVALVAVTGMALLLGRRGIEEVSGIETRYVPVLELGRDLQTAFSAIAQALESAASAAEEGGLAEADRRRDRFLAALAAGRRAIADNGGDESALRAEFLDYYELARQVTARIIVGQTDDDLLPTAQAMRAAQQRFAAHVQAGTTPDRVRVAAAFESARRAHSLGAVVDVAIASVAFVAMLLLAWWIIGGTAASLQAVSHGVERLARGDFSQEISVPTRDEFGDLAREANRTALRLREYRVLAEQEDWVKSGTAGLAGEIAGELSSVELGRRALSYLARYIDAPVAAAYAAGEDGSLSLLETYAHGGSLEAAAGFGPGQGMLGQAARDGELRHLSDVPEDYVAIRSGLGAARPRHLLAVPFSHEGRCMGVFEFGLLGPPPRQALELIGRTRALLGIGFQGAESRQRVQALVDKMQGQADELHRASDFLRAQNQALKASELRLHLQQEELREVNDQLEQQAQALEAQRSALVVKNGELEEARQVIEQKASELARASKYKSDFLANMSHELRTPLNSIMILAKILAANEDGVLGPRQLEFAQVIHKSGEELLTLINDVLDLAKIEAGKQDLLYAAVAVEEVARYVRQMFEPFARQKGLDFEVELAEGLPALVHTDLARLEQILKNLLSNAIKFTERGRIEVRFFRPETGAASIAIAVADTGIGIPRSKQELIFEAFAQADGGTSRTHGGTGLGLAIARQLAIRLGGGLRVQSEVGLGSTFLLELPIEEPRRRAASSAPPRPRPRPHETEMAVRVPDDRLALAPGDDCFLVMERDVATARTLVDLVRQSGARVLASASAAEGLGLAARFRPGGILLDVGLPDLDPWEVMERLQADAATREIPVCLLGAVDDPARAAALGAVGILARPARPEDLLAALMTLERAASPAPRVLVVEKDAGVRETLCNRLSGMGAAIESAASEAEALARLEAGPFGVVVLAPELPDSETGLAVLRRMRDDPRTASTPVIVHAGSGALPADQTVLAGGERTIVVADGAGSVERVLGETRRLVRRLGADSHDKDGVDLAGKRVLLVDDDMRHVYSLTHALQSARLEIVAATDGLEALEQLEAHADTDIILMDIAMPRMDGHEAIRRIRRHPRFHQTPIIAITARTAPGEREECLEAGASDYVPKPVDVPQLLSRLRAWLAG